ncbi:MAG TPA: putative lipid II flippase FtsW [Acidiferrobacteraceae bacterium]|nr:putative lipid II flippase FtsW [Acidiferrobacteraceae bacterium]
MRLSDTRFDPYLLGAVAFLVLFGLVMIYSASIAIARQSTGDPAHFLLHQTVSVGIAVCAAAVILRTRLAFWREAGPYLLLMGLGMLVLVLIPGIGEKINGSSRWINLRFVSIQPSEFLKLIAVVYVAGYLTRRRDQLTNFVRGVVMVGVVLGVLGILLLKEPDFGTTVVISVTVLGMMFLAGVSVWHFLAFTTAGAGCMALLTVISPYRLGRVLSFLHPWTNAYGSGFQLTQALIGFGRGGLWGVGLGNSVQKLFYLPDPQTDFLFAIVGEELGVIGVLCVIAAFSVLVLRAFLIGAKAERAGDYFAARLAEGIGLLFALQAMVNMGVDMGVLPTKGLTLPFMSYGGSSTLLSGLLIALLLRVQYETALSGGPA